MLERVVLGCIKVSTGKKGFSLFSVILAKSGRVILHWPSPHIDMIVILVEHTVYFNTLYFGRYFLVLNSLVYTY